MQNFDYEIIEHITTLKENITGNYTTEVNLISYNGTAPKIDIRKWDRANNRMLRGISLTEDEAKQLKECLATRF